MIFLMKGVVGSGSTRKGGIRKRSKHRKQVGPSLVSLRRRNRNPIAERIRVGIPVPDKEIKGGEEVRRSGKLIKKVAASRSVSVGINVGNLINLPLEAEGCS